MAPADSVKQHYPTWRHHENGAETIVETADADAKLGPGWHRSSDPATWPDELPLGELPAADAPEAQTATTTSSYVVQRYPSWRYHEDGREQLVVDALADRQLAAAEEGWHRSPDKSTWDGEEALGLEDDDAPVPALPAQPPSVPPVLTEEEQEALRCEQLWKTPVADVIDKVDELTDVAVLQRIREREAKNPKFEGGRKGVLEAIDETVAALTK